MKMPVMKKLSMHVAAQADSFIQTFPDKYNTYIEQVVRMCQVDRSKDFVLQEPC